MSESTSALLAAAEHAIRAVGLPISDKLNHIEMAKMHLEKAKAIVMKERKAEIEFLRGTRCCGDEGGSR